MDKIIKVKFIRLNAKSNNILCKYVKYYEDEN